MRGRRRWMNWILRQSAGDLPLLPWQHDRRPRHGTRAPVLRRIV